MILSILLGILKIIGIILLILLLFILLILLSVLLVPVRYRGHALHGSDSTRAEFHVSWLLHLVSVHFSYELQEKQQEFIIRIFGLRLDMLKNLFQHRKPKKKRQKREAPQDSIPPGDQLPKEKYDTDKPVELEDAEHNSDKPDNTEQIPDEPDITDQISDKPDNTEQIPDEPDITDQISDEPDNTEQIPDELEFIEHNESGQRSFSKKNSGKASGKRFDLKNRIGNLKTKLRRLKSGFQSGIQHIQEYRALYEEYAIPELSQFLWGKAIALLKHYLPVKASGYLHFGTGDPASTGELTGIFYYFLPPRAAVSIDPDFTEKALELDLIFSGHIRAIHLVITGWNLYRNKQLKRLIAKIRGK